MKCVQKKRRADLGEFARGAEVGDADGGVGGGEEVLDVGRDHIDWAEILKRPYRLGRNSQKSAP